MSDSPLAVLIGALVGILLGWVEVASYGWARGVGRDPDSTSRDAE